MRDGIVKLPEEWLVDYQPARDKAIRWLGERYLLAREIKRLTPTSRSAAARHSGQSQAAGNAQHT